MLFSLTDAGWGCGIQTECRCGTGASDLNPVGGPPTGAALGSRLHVTARWRHRRTQSTYEQYGGTGGNNDAAASITTGRRLRSFRPETYGERGDAAAGGQHGLHVGRSRRRSCIGSSAAPGWRRQRRGDIRPSRRLAFRSVPGSGLARQIGRGEALPRHGASGSGSSTRQATITAKIPYLPRQSTLVGMPGSMTPRR